MIEIRPFQRRDQHAAQALILDGLTAHWGWLDPTRNPDLNNIGQSYADGTFLVAWADDDLVGTGALIPEGLKTARIVRMSVATAVRRQGVGQQLLEALVAVARHQGVEQLVLETTSTWQEAIAFYKKNGFTVTYEAEGETHFVRALRD